MTERTAKEILSELIEEADSKYIVEMISGSRRGINDYYIRGAVGELVTSLPPEEREKLDGLKPEDIKQMFAAYRRPRPEQPTTRRRGPVTLSKGNKDD
ncbi:MAG: hypothetical protein KAJ19_20980 [Gammaproteobacteria bacterium]|nr:hypothetical protein [Gammaproteobacteria bacterium]